MSSSNVQPASTVSPSLQVSSYPGEASKCSSHATSGKLIDEEDREELEIEDEEIDDDDDETELLLLEEIDDDEYDEDDDEDELDDETDPNSLNIKSALKVGPLQVSPEFAL